MKEWWSLFIVLLLAAACVPTLEPRSGMPTAIPAASAVSLDSTPLARRSQLVAAGPTSTPAPWATSVPSPPPGPPPKIPHQVNSGSDCLACHSGTYALPPDHKGRRPETCRGCHSVNYDALQVTGAPIPHGVAGQEDCLKCHLRSIAGARPMPGEHTGRPTASCGRCHKPKGTS